MLMVMSMTDSDELTYGEYVFPRWSMVLGWSMNAAFILPIPLVFVYAFIRYSDSKKSFKERLRLLFVPTITKRQWKQQMENGDELRLTSTPSLCV